MTAYYPLIINTGSTQIQELPSGGDLNLTGSNISNVGAITVTNVGTAIINGATSGVGNIGATGAEFNTIFAKATTAQYADLAENYVADSDYVPGTVVVFGGAHEITVTDQQGDERVAGVISTNPAYLMNSVEPGLPLALRGKVPTRVIGTVVKGDSLTTSTTPGVAVSVGHSRDYAQAVFAKALESSDDANEKVILSVIL